jgi:DNA-binding transcriptional ArsR family regulator
MKVNEHTPVELQQLAQLSKAIGHPARLAILQAIAAEGGKIMGKIVDIPGISPTTVIQHLRELKRAGLVEGRIFGAQCHYGLDASTLKLFTQLWEEIVKNGLTDSNAP